MDPQLLHMFADGVVRLLLKEIAHRRSLSFLEIRESVPHVRPTELRKDLRKLEEKHLVGVIAGGDPDFNTYYLTAEGLKSYRALSNTFALS